MAVPECSDGVIRRVIFFLHGEPPDVSIIVSPFNGCIQQYDNDRKDT